MDEESFDMKNLVEEAINDDDETFVEEKPKKSKRVEESDDDDEGMFVKDDLFSEKPGWKGVKYFTLVGITERILNIRFSKFFGKESEDYENFITSCMAKKAYHKLMHLFCHTANVILNQNKVTSQSFLYRYYCLKRDLDNDVFEDNNSQQFISGIVNLFDRNIINEIRKFINIHYIPVVPEDEDEDEDVTRKNFIPAITFKNYHIKILFVVSRMTHFIAPLCLEYLKVHKEVDAKRFLADTFTTLFQIAEQVGENVVPLTKHDSPTDVYQKIYSFVESKVEDTLKSDEIMWERQSFLGVNWKTTVEQIVDKLIVDITPELSFNGNPLNMFSTVTRKSTSDYVLRKRDPFNINMLVDVDSNSSDDDNSVVTEAEQFDSYNTKHDAFGIYVRHTFMEDTVFKILSRNNVVVDPSEIEYYMKNLHFHKFQTFAIFSSTLKYWGGTENIYSLNQENYIKLMVMISQMCKRSGLVGLSNYITGIKNRHYISKKESRIAHQLLVQDPLYNYIIDTKYKGIRNIIMKKNNFIETRISYLTNNEFAYNLPDSEFNGQIIPRNEDMIRQEVLRFFNEFIY